MNSTIGLRLAVGLPILLIAVESNADEPPLAMAEARIGQGLALGGGSGESNWRFSPLSFTALASMAIETQPAISVYGGLYFETGNRAAIGATAGLRLMPQGGDTRVSIAALVVALPASAYGATVGLGRCHGVTGGIGFCMDLEATVFALGADLPKGRIATQIQAVMGIAIDVM